MNTPYLGFFELIDNDQLNNLIATIVMEIVKFDQIEKQISDGLLSCPEDIDGIVQDGWRKLKHTCVRRSLITLWRSYMALSHFAIGWNLGNLCLIL
jgi:hypothetical protein